MNREIESKVRDKFIEWGWEVTDTGYKMTADKFFVRYEQSRDEPEPIIDFDNLAMPGYGAEDEKVEDRRPNKSIKIVPIRGRGLTQK